MSYELTSAFLSSLMYDRSRVNVGTIGSYYIDPQGGAWELKNFEPGTGDGYQGAVFVNADTHAVVMVNRGTEPTSFAGDFYNDLQMGIGQLPDQFASAKALFERAQGIAVSIGVSPDNILVT